ncbi:MAG TPA: hypothetical protein VGA67_03845 [Candidatus Dojkabacteria bacterium]|jgi:hypothetical protein
MSDKKKLSIIQFDSDDHYFTVIDLILSTWGMELAGKAFSPNSATRLFERIQKGEIKPDIAIVEADMGKSEEDGKKISAKLRDAAPGIKIIGFSVIENSEWSDYEAIKGLKDTNKVITDILSKVTGNEYKISNTEDGKVPEEISND